MNKKYFLLLLIPIVGILNRIRGGLPIFGRELSTFWGKLAISIIMALSIYGHWYLMAGTFAMSFIGLSLSHGSWFPKATDMDYDAFGFIAVWFPNVNREIINTICMALTGLTATSGLSVSLFILDMPWMAVMSIVIGLFKSVAYQLGELTPSLVEGFKKGIEWSEVYFGMFIGLMLAVVLILRVFSYGN